MGAETSFVRAAMGCKEAPSGARNHEPPVATGNTAVRAYVAASLAFGALSCSTVIGVYFASERDIGDRTGAAYRSCGIGYARSNEALVNKDLDHVTDMGQWAIKQFRNRSLIAYAARESKPNV